MDKKSHIGIAGFGVEGKSVLKYLINHGFENITIYDEGTAIEDIPANVSNVIGADCFTKIDGLDLLFRSPGIHPEKLKKAAEKNIVITSATKYFFENCPSKIIGVTGTKGKGTTSTLIKLILEKSGLKTYLGGNIGDSPLDFLDELSDESIVVLELSSFQLQDLTMSPHIAVVLMTTTEHLDYHRDQNDYWEAKTPILLNQSEDDFFVINKDYDYSKKFAELSKGIKFEVSKKGPVQNGAYMDNGRIFFTSDGDTAEQICNTDSVGLIGAHNLENIMAAIVVGEILQTPKGVIKDVIQTFTGLPHRLEFVKEVNGVSYYNDSFSTTPETSIAAVKSFKQDTLLIAGGSEKNSDYTEWGQELSASNNIKFIALIGMMAERMKQSLVNADFKGELMIFETFEDAFKGIQSRVTEGSVVLLSPAAASFDMFKNYKERGEAFRKLVSKISTS